MTARVAKPREALKLTPLQYVRPNGSLTSLGKQAAIEVDTVLGWYRDMYLGRRLDQEAQMLQRQGELDLWLMSLGQEAAQVGSVRALRATDYVFPSYREHVAAQCRGLTPTELLAQWRGCTHAGWSIETNRFHFYSLVLGTQALHATGYAMALMREEPDGLVMVYLGDGATSQGDVSEAFNFAAVARAPVLFFCQNNHWAISTPSKSQYAAPLTHRAAGFGIASWQVDGNDVIAVHEITRQAADHVRSGNGPAFVEAMTFRMAGHSTSDDPNRYRTHSEVKHWAERDPLTRTLNFLRARGVQQEVFDSLQVVGDSLAEEVRAACKALPEPELLDLFDHAYAEPHSLVELQRRAHAGIMAKTVDRR